MQTLIILHFRKKKIANMWKFPKKHSTKKQKQEHVKWDFKESFDWEFLWGWGFGRRSEIKTKNDKKSKQTKQITKTKRKTVSYWLLMPSDLCFAIRSTFANCWLRCLVIDVIWVDWLRFFLLFMIFYLFFFEFFFCVEKIEMSYEILAINFFSFFV